MIIVVYLVTCLLLVIIHNTTVILILLQSLVCMLYFTSFTVLYLSYVIVNCTFKLYDILCHNFTNV